MLHIRKIFIFNHWNSTLSLSLSLSLSRARARSHHCSFSLSRSFFFPIVLYIFLSPYLSKPRLILFLLVKFFFLSLFLVLLMRQMPNGAGFWIRSQRNLGIFVGFVIENEIGSGSVILKKKD